MEISEKDRRKIFGHPLFAGVDPSTADAVFQAHGCAVASCAEGDLILSPEKPQKKVGILLQGRASVTTKGDAKKAFLRFLHEGDLFGIANLFTEEPFVSVICADRDCRIFFLTEGAVRALLETNSAFLYRYLSFLSGRICYLNRKIGYLTAGSAERRLALYLASFQQEVLVLTDSISNLSELLNVGRASLYRAFERLHADGYIQKDGRTIRILHLEAMLKAYQ